jgi:hypothetical protein
MFFALVILIGLATGLTHGAQLVFWKEDVKPLSYFLILPFFLLAIRDADDIRIISRIVMVSALIIAMVFFVTLVLIYSNTVPFLTFYKLTLGTEELFFRGEYTFFYKGFLYLGIGIVFGFFLLKKPINYILIAVLSLALLLSLTRGMMLAISLTFCIYFFFSRSVRKTILTVLVSIIVLFKGATVIRELSLWLAANQNFLLTHIPSVRRSSDILLGDRSYSDSQRMLQIKEVMGSTSFSSSWIGHGFGIGVPDRPVHMEISYLEIFHKQGVIGLAFWCVLFWMLWVRYERVSERPEAKAFFFSAVFIFLQSVTNQYINNPIGLSMLLLALVCLDRMNKPITAHD